MKNVISSEPFGVDGVQARVGFNFSLLRGSFGWQRHHERAAAEACKRPSGPTLKWQWKANFDALYSVS